MALVLHYIPLCIYYNAFILAYSCRNIRRQIWGKCYCVSWLWFYGMSPMAGYQMSSWMCFLTDVTNALTITLLYIQNVFVLTLMGILSRHRFIALKWYERMHSMYCIIFHRVAVIDYLHEWAHVHVMHPYSLASQSTAVSLWMFFINHQSWWTGLVIGRTDGAFHWAFEF